MNEAQMPGPLALFCKMEARLHTALLWLSGTALGLIAFISLYQILARFVFSMPNSWTEVLARTVMVWMIFLALPAVFSQGSLVAFDFLANLLPRSLRAVLTALIGAVNIVTLCVILWFGIRMTIRVSGQAMAGLEFVGATMAWGYSALPVGAFFALPGVLAWLVKSVYQPKTC